MRYWPDGVKKTGAEQVMNADDNTAYLTRTLAYSYDPRDRITQVQKDGAVSESYAHEANDNVTSQTINGTTTTSNYDRDRLLTAVTSGVTSSYNYDPFGRLDAATTAGTLTERNSYDGFGRHCTISHPHISPKPRPQNVTDPLITGAHIAVDMAPVPVGRRGRRCDTE